MGNAVVSTRTIVVSPTAQPSTIDTPGFNGSFGPVTGSASASLVKTGAGQLAVQRIRTGSLTINEGEVQIPSGPAPVEPARVSDIETFFINGGPSAPTARLDLGNNGMIVGSTPEAPEGGPDAETQIGQYIMFGHGGGSWTGNGITSTATDFAGSGHFGLGYGEAGSLGIMTFLGLPVSPTDTLVRYTRYGDSNLDGVVSLADFNALAANFGSTDAVWREGDFNYDFIVNLADFNLLAGNFGLSAGPDGVVDPEDWAALMSAVPEPTMGGLLLMIAPLLSRRRRA